MQVVRDMPAAFDDDITDVALCGDEVVGEHCPPTTARIWRFRDHGEEKGEPLPAADIRETNKQKRIIRSLHFIYA